MIIDELNKDIAKFMKEANKENLTTLKMAKNAIQTEKINKNHDLSNDEVIAVLRKYIKQKNTDIEEYSKFNKDDVVASLKKEIELIDKYLPEEMSVDDINKGLDQIFDKVKPESIKDMGRLMKEANDLFGVNVDKALVSKLIKERLS